MLTISYTKSIIIVSVINPGSLLAKVFRIQDGIFLRVSNVLMYELNILLL